MPLDIFESKQNDPEEPADPNEVRVALAWLLSSDGTIDFKDSRWVANFDGANGLEFHDETNDTIAYLPPGAEGDITSGGSGGDGGADETATYVTHDDESSSLENSQQHADLSGSDLHDPAEHGNDAHSETYAADGDPQPPEDHAIGGSMHTASTLADLNALVDDATLDDESSTRPPETHDNSAHSSEFIVDGDGVERAHYLIENGASDPADAGPEDIIFEEEA